MNKKRILALCCAVLLLVTAAGCSKTTGGNEADTEAVYSAMEKLENCTSCISLQTTERAVTVTESGITYTYSETNEKELTLISSPVFKMRIKNRSHTVYNGQETNENTVSYIVPENGGYCEYLSDGSTWYSVYTEDEIALFDVQVADLASMFMLDGLSFRKAKTETLSSGNAVRYDASLTGTDLVSFLYNSGYLDSITSMSENQQTKILENLVNDLDSVTVSVWVDEATGYPVRFAMDVTDILAEMDESISKTLGGKDADAQWTMTKSAMCMELWSFNAVDDLVPPPESANATPIDPSDYAQ